jgi:hypothetical protein
MGDVNALARLKADVNKAFRIRGDGARHLYVTARKAGRFLRDAPRRAAWRRLPPGDPVIPAAAGYCLVPPDHFPEVPQVVDAARQALAHYDEVGPADGKRRKRFLVNVQDPATLTRDSAIVRLALREEVLAAVSRYLGVIPFLSAISVFHSDTVDGDFSSSQLHHCDGDDVTQVKIFVYCSDVDMASGPFTLMRADDSARIRRATGYHYRRRLTDEQVSDVVGPSREIPILGEAGTVLFVDTSRCFHYGSRVADGAPPRLVTMIQYQTPYSFMLPTSAQRSLPFRRLIDPSLTPLQQLVLGA